MICGQARQDMGLAGRRAGTPAVFNGKQARRSPHLPGLLALPRLLPGGQLPQNHPAIRSRAERRCQRRLQGAGRRRKQAERDSSMRPEAHPKLNTSEAGEAPSPAITSGACEGGRQAAVGAQALQVTQAEGQRQRTAAVQQRVCTWWAGLRLDTRCQQARQDKEQQRIAPASVGRRPPGCCRPRAA